MKPNLKNTKKVLSFISKSSESRLVFPSECFNPLIERYNISPCDIIEHVRYIGVSGFLIGDIVWDDDCTFTCPTRLSPAGHSFLTRDTDILMKFAVKFLEILIDTLFKVLLCFYFL